MVDIPFYFLFSVFTCYLLAISVNTSIGWASPALVKLHSNDSTINPIKLPLTTTEDSWVGSLLTIGALIGPFPYSLIARQLGRKTALLSVAVPLIVSYLTLAFVPNLDAIYGARVLGGIALGGGYTLIPMYLSEISEPQYRNKLFTFMSFFFNCGTFLVQCVGPYTSFLWFNVVLTCVPILFLALFLLAPDSPYYLVTHNRGAEAQLCLERLRYRSTKAEIQSELKDMLVLAESEKAKASFWDLFRQKAYIRGLIISSVLVISLKFSGINVVLFYTQEIFIDSGVYSISPANSAIIVTFVLMFTGIFIPFVVERSGRRPLMVVSCLGVAISYAGLGTFFYLKASNYEGLSSISWLPITCLIFYNVFFAIGLGPIPWTASSELFPTHVKPYAAAITTVIAWLSAFITTKFFADLNGFWGEAGTFWFFGVCCLASCVFVITYVPETKGKSFNEIQAILNK